VSYYLGIDGGGTKTTCAVGDEQRLLAMATAGPSNIVRVGEARARESLHEGVRQACAAAGIAREQIVGACVGVAGAARPQVAALVRDILSEIVDVPTEVVGDMHTALEAAFGDGPGVAVNAGTGSFAYGRDANGMTARAGGWGFAISDEGSAHWIGRAAVSALLRAADRTPESSTARAALEQAPYPTALMKAWGVTSIADLARAANSIPPPDFAALFPAVAASGDEGTAQVLTQAGRELAQLAATVTHRLFPSDQPSDQPSDRIETVPVAMTGGVFRHAKLVREIFYNELRQLDPRADISLEIIEPVEGALRMARSKCGEGAPARRS